MMRRKLSWKEKAKLVEYDTEVNGISIRGGIGKVLHHTVSCQENLSSPNGPGQIRF